MARSHSSCVKSSRTPETRSFGLIGRRQTGQIRSFLLLAPRGAARFTKIHPSSCPKDSGSTNVGGFARAGGPAHAPTLSSNAGETHICRHGASHHPDQTPRPPQRHRGLWAGHRAHMLRPFRPRPTFGLERQREVVHRLSLCELWCGGRRRSPSAFTCVEQNATPGPTSAAGTRQDGKAFHALI